MTSLLQNACLNGCIRVAKQVLRHADLSSDDNLSFRLAAQNGHVKIVQMLLDQPLSRGVDPSAGDNDAFVQAVQNGHVEVVQALLQSRRVDPNARNNFAMRHACSNQDWDMISLLKPHTDYIDGLLYAGLPLPVWYKPCDEDPIAVSSSETRLNPTIGPMRVSILDPSASCDPS